MAYANPLTVPFWLTLSSLWTKSIYPRYASVSVTVTSAERSSGDALGDADLECSGVDGDGGEFLSGEIAVGRCTNGANSCTV